jgi:hypothetical protein
MPEPGDPRKSESDCAPERPEANSSDGQIPVFENTSGGKDSEASTTKKRKNKKASGQETNAPAERGPVLAATEPQEAAAGGDLSSTNAGPTQTAGKAPAKASKKNGSRSKLLPFGYACISQGRDQGIHKRKYDKNGEPFCVPITNFLVKSVRTIIEDDGTDRRSQYKIEAEKQGVVRAGVVSDADFQKMQWPRSLLGFGATVFPHMNEEARVAIQLTTKMLEEQVIYVASGWRVINGEAVFLHASGAIGWSIENDPAIPPLKASLKETLQHIRLPASPTGQQLQKAVRASLGLLEVAEPSVSVPLLAAVYRAPLGESDFAMHFHGLTGSLKTTIAVVGQQHFGKDFTDKKLPAYWNATSNFNQERLFSAKDVLTVVDDFVPKGPQNEIERWHQKFDEVVRSATDGALRGRLRSSGEERPSHGPRGLILSTGEVVPKGESILARVVNVEVKPHSVNKQKLNQCQDDATAGLYAQSMSGYLLWLSQGYSTLRTRVHQRIRELRLSATKSDQHLRTPENLANLGVGIEMFLKFALAKQAITPVEFQKRWDHCWETLITLGAAQNVQQQNEDPIREALRLLASADQAGQIFFRCPDGSEVGQNSQALRTDNFIGWRNDENSDWLCEPNRLYAKIKRLFEEQGRTLPLKKSDLFQRMIDRGYLPRSDEPDRYTVKRKIDGERKRVIAITPEAFAKAEGVTDEANSDQKPLQPKRPESPSTAK